MNNDEDPNIPIMLSKNLLILTVKSAKGVRKADLLSKSDPFVEVTLKEQIVKTETVQDCSDPHWN
jgi:Ca2+-dependent lipid-binding protein